MRSGFPDFLDQPDPEIQKFVRILNGLEMTVNLIYYVQKVIFGAPDGPDPPDGAGATGVHLGGGASMFSSPDGQEAIEAIDIPNVLLRCLNRQKIG